MLFKWFLIPPIIGYIAVSIFSKSVHSGSIGTTIICGCGGAVFERWLFRTF